MDQVSSFEKISREKGLKVTPQRVEIFKAIGKAIGHPSVEEIYEVVKRILPAISLDTVYRTINMFEHMGIVKKIIADNGTFRFDTNLDNHQHLICIVCGRIEDYNWVDFERLALPETSKWTDLEVANVEIKGICKDCRK